MHTLQSKTILVQNPSKVNLFVSLGKLALGIEGCDGRRELSHGVDIGGEVVEQGDHVAGQLGPAGPLRGQAPHLLLGGHLASEQQPEETLGKWLLAAGGLG